MSDRGRTGMTLSLPTDLVEALTVAADERVVGRNLLIERLLRDGLTRLIPVDQFVRPAPVLRGGIRSVEPPDVSLRCDE